MDVAALSSLPSDLLARRLAALAGDERAVQADFLLHLDEFDRRRAYLPLGFPSLWAYCLTVLHLREGAAGRRIGAMRVLRRLVGEKLAFDLAATGRVVDAAEAVRLGLISRVLPALSVAISVAFSSSPALYGWAKKAR